MAKYCFYCGQELATGEKCNCRGRRDSAATGTKSSQYSQSSSKQKTTTGNHGRANTKSAKHAKATKTNKRTADRPIFRFGTLRDQVRTLFPTLTSSILSGSGYLLRPATKIRQESLRTKRPFSIVTIIVFAILTGLLSIVLVQSDSPLFVSMLTVVFGDAVVYLSSQPLPSLLLVTFFAGLIILTIAALFYVAARLNARRTTFRRALDLVSISLVYVMVLEAFLLTTVLLGSRGSFSIIFVSIILMGITQMLSFKNALSLSEDSVFLSIIFVYLTAYMAIKLYLMICIPILGLLFPI